jgi:transcriptional regulator with XRE-family HTH domain
VSVSIHEEIGRLLAVAREDDDLTQKQVAEKLGVNQSWVSRLESGVGEPEPTDYQAFLKALRGDRAKRARRLLAIEWKHLPRPSLNHPDIDILIEAELALERLQAFSSGEKVPHVLVGQAELLSNRLRSLGDYLLSTSHTVAYFGDIGVGKTTAACCQAGLVVDPMNPSDLRGVMLDTGGGRTTLCEAEARAGQRYALQVDPLPDEEVYRLVSEFCRSVRERRGERESGSADEFKLPEEVERALRSMASLQRPPRRKGAPIQDDPAATLSDTFPSIEDFQAEVASRLTLWRRTRRTMEFEGPDDIAGRKWLKEAFVRINNGRNPDFSMPAKITVSVPFAPIPNTSFDISIVDTRGIDGSAIRPDIVAQLKNRRAVCMLCTKWGSAPDVSLQQVLKHVAETEVDPTFLSRTAILVLARAGDALTMRHDSGDTAQDAFEGYEIKRGHVEDALARADLTGISVQVFDSVSDGAKELSSFLIEKVTSVRKVQADNVMATVQAIDEMLANVERSQALAVLQQINSELLIFAGRHQKLAKSKAPAHTRLLEIISSRHARTVWAAARRSGSFWNFDVYESLGDGAAAEAMRRGASAISGLREIIENWIVNPEFASARGFLNQILQSLSTWEADFVKAARHHAITVYKPELSDADHLWQECDNLYGQRLNFRDIVTSKLSEWFDRHDNLQDEVERRTRRAWVNSFLKPLSSAAGGRPTDEA